MGHYERCYFLGGGGGGGKLIASNKLMSVYLLECIQRVHNRFGGMRDFAIQFAVILVGMRAENRSGMREL